MQSLVPCNECHRHVRLGEPVCPFCEAVVASPRVSPDTTRRLGRAAAFVFGATVAVTACGGETVVAEDDGGGGASSATSGTSATTGVGGAGGAGGVSDGGGMQTLYGGPATGGMDPSGSGGFMAEYGAPPPPEE